MPKLMKLNNKLKMKLKIYEMNHKQKSKSNKISMAVTKKVYQI